MHAIKSRRIARFWLPLAIAFGAPLVVLVLVRTYVVNVPFLDEWQWSAMMIHLREGQQSWSEISALHNEQNILVPTLVALSLAAIRHSWVITRETTLSVSILFATLGVWWAVILRLVPSPRRYWTLALISMLASSLTQAENWVWGFQLSFFIANFCVAVMVLTWVSADRTWSLPVGLAALIIASYSIGTGFMGTIGGMAFYALTRKRFPFLAWTLFSIVLLALYRSAFHASLYRPVDANPLDQIRLISAFAFAALGAPIARSSGVEICIVLGVIASVLIIAHLRADSRSSHNDYGGPAISALALMGILAAVEIAYGRAFEGTQAALSGRFTTPLSMLWISLVLAASRVDPRRIRIFVLGSIPLAILWCVSQIAGYTEIRDRSLSLFAAAQVIPRWDTANEDEFPPLWPAETVLGYLHGVGEGPFLNQGP